MKMLICHDIVVEIRVHLIGVIFVFPTHVPGIQSGHQIWQQMPLPSVTSLQTP